MHLGVRLDSRFPRPEINSVLSRDFSGGRWFVAADVLASKFKGSAVIEHRYSGSRTDFGPFLTKSYSSATN
jgi:hypothetical protein